MNRAIIALAIIIGLLHLMPFSLKAQKAISYSFKFCDSQNVLNIVEGNNGSVEGIYFVDYEQCKRRRSRKCKKIRFEEKIPAIQLATLLAKIRQDGIDSLKYWNMKNTDSYLDADYFIISIMYEDSSKSSFEFPALYPIQLDLKKETTFARAVAQNIVSTIYEHINISELNRKIYKQLPKGFYYRSWYGITITYLNKKRLVKLKYKVKKLFKKKTR